MRYQIEWLNDGPGATGFVGWTADGIGEENQFATQAEAQAMAAELAEESAFNDMPRRFRVVPLPASAPLTQPE